MTSYVARQARIWHYVLVGSGPSQNIKVIEKNVYKRKTILTYYRIYWYLSLLILDLLFYTLECIQSKSGTPREGTLTPRISTIAFIFRIQTIRLNASFARKMDALYTFQNPQHITYFNTFATSDRKHIQAQAIGDILY